MHTCDSYFGAHHVANAATPIRPLPEPEKEEPAEVKSGGAAELVADRNLSNPKSVFNP